MNTKEQQDRMWNDLSKKNKELMSEKAHALSSSIEACPCGQGLEDAQELQVYINLFGEYNLFPERRCKNWGEYQNRTCSDIIVEKGKYGWNIDIKGVSFVNPHILNMMISIPKIFNLIEDSYGGVVDPQYMKENPVWAIIPKLNFNNLICEPDIVFEVKSKTDEFGFLLFKTEEYAKEFLKNNQDLVEDFYIFWRKIF